MSGEQDRLSGISQRDPAVDFIDNRLADALAEASKEVPAMTRYDEAAGLYVPVLSAAADHATTMTPQDDLRQLPPAVAAMRFWDVLFSEAMSQLQSKHLEPDAKRRILNGHSYDIRRKPNWAEVYDELQAAKTVYDGKGSARHVKKGLRIFFDKVRLVQPATVVMPAVEYLSPVLGSLQIIIDAAAQSRKVRELAADSLSDDELETAFGEIEMFLGIFPGDEMIEKRAVELVVAILKAIEDAIGYYLENICSRAGKAVFLGGDYQKALKESLSQIKTSSEALIREAQTSNFKQVRDMWSQVRDYSQRLIENDKQMMANQQVMIGNQHKILDEQKALADMQNSFKAMFDEYRKYLDQRYEQQLRVKDEQIMALSLLANGHLPNSPPSMPQPQQSTFYLPQRNLLALLGMSDWKGDSDDMNLVSQKAYLVPSEHRGRAEQVVGTWAFKEFVVVPSSSVLLVHGDFSDGMHHVSALTSVSWALSGALKGLEGFKALTFFCGCHVEPDHTGRTSGGQGMIRSLIAQLLQQHEFDTKILHEQVNLDAVAAGDLGWLCHLFVWLACHLPPKTTLMCLVDGINLYEREVHIDSVRVVLDCLLTTTRDERLLGILKVLVTSPVPTTIVRQHAAFHDGLNTVNMASLPKLGWGASSERMNRHLGEAFRGSNGSENPVSNTANAVPG